MRQLIFVVESEIEVSQLAQQCLEAAGYTVRTFATANVLEEAERRRPALVLTAMMMPDGNGLDLCRRIRENPSLSGIPVVFLIAAAAEEHRVLALESGGDDCIATPFSPRELVARLQAVLRRFVTPMPPPQGMSADLLIDSSAMRVSVRGNEVATTSLEFRLIEYLARHRGQVFTRDLLLDAVWGDMQFVTPRTVDACVRRIREKIEPDRENPKYLKTIRGVGYRLDAIAAWERNAGDACTCSACTRPMASQKAHPPGTPRVRRIQHQN